MANANQKLGQIIMKRMKWNDHELGLIKQTFAEQEELLILVRKFLLQGEMEDSEMKYLMSFTSSPEILAILKKTINPQLDKQASLFNAVDLYSGMDLQPTPADHAFLSIKSKELMDNYLTSQFVILEKGGDNKIRFDDLVKPLEDDIDQTFINFTARNSLLSHIDTQLQLLAISAGTKDETPEQQKRRLTQDSSK